MSRIAVVSQEKADLSARLAYRYSRKKLGRVVTPLEVMAHNPWVLRSSGAYEMLSGNAKAADAKLKSLAGIKAAAMIGCPF